jgi:site-specific DNA-methyltransferase (adenine-specific)/adenine-specific DNA-methyltransferase
MPTLNWIGKEAVVNHHLEVPFRLLKDVPELACGDPGSGNLIVEGDNLVALKALLPYYKAKVKCICIDPPYNTGNEGWTYNDNVNSSAIRKWIGDTVGGEGETLDRHDRWLCMMYPRLALLREFLSEDGSIFITLDDNEIANLRLLLGEVFGENNFVSHLIWQKKYSPQNDARFFSEMHDHILVYAKSGSNWIRNLIPRTAKQDRAYKNPDNDLRGLWKASDLTRAEHRDRDYYGIVTPAGKTAFPAKGRSWSRPVAEIERLRADNRLWFGTKGDAIPSLKRFLSEVKDGLVPTTILGRDECGDNQESKQELKEIGMDTLFTTPKPTRLIERILQIATNPGDLVLDSFAGSGTTGHAVLKMNATAKNSEQRRFILVEMDEKIAPEITRERVKRVAEGYKNAKGEKVPGLGGGLRYVRLGDELFDEHGRINETKVRFADLARHVYFSETGEPLPKERVSTKTPLLGVHHGRAVYLLYNGILKDKSVDGGNVLTTMSLKHLPAHNGPKVVYAAGCRFSKARLEGENITFKQTPYSIRTS